jgi:hypothetical protein
LDDRVSIELVAFHLNKGRFVVGVSTYLRKILDSGDVL